MPTIRSPLTVQAAPPSKPVTRRSLLGDALHKALELIAQKAGARLRSFDELAELAPEQLLQITPLRCRVETDGAIPPTPRDQAEAVLLEHGDGRHRLAELARILAERQGRAGDAGLEHGRHQICEAFLRLVESGCLVPHGEVPEASPASDAAAPDKTGDPG